MHNGALKVVKSTTLFGSTQEKSSFFVFFSSEIFAHIVYFFDYQSIAKKPFQLIIFPFQRRFFAIITHIGCYSSREERIRPLPTSHPLSMPLVLLNHLFCLLCLVLVVRRLGLVVLLFRLFFHPFHLPLSLTLCPRHPRSGTRTQHQNERQEADDQCYSSLHDMQFGVQK